MALLQWNDELQVHIPDIDEQHRRFIGYIGELHELRRRKNSLNAMGGLLNELLDYARVHFKTEERYFDMFSYDEASLHKKEHARLLQKLEDFKKSYDAQADLFLAMKLANFLSEWLEDHLVKIDRNFARQLLEANSPG
ncbi:MAG: hypothetical protein C4563_10850 [Desulfobulbus sp.]|nr:MAG: hypothetical protein C4563_10850 [Desulfobulbus sp.]